METLKISPLQILREHNKRFKQQQKTLNRRIRNKKCLAEQIYQNNNIFQSKINLQRNMVAQNIIWDKNYSYKQAINTLKEENSSLKARIWNVQKQNRRMGRQVDSWNLNKQVDPNLVRGDISGSTSGLKDIRGTQSSSICNPAPRRPYIDMATVEKVVSDQDYNIVSIKIEILELEKTLQQKENQAEIAGKRIKDAQKILSFLNHEIANKKVQLCGGIQSENSSSNLIDQKEDLSVRSIKQTKQLQVILKNIELKKRSKAALQSQLTGIVDQCDMQKDVTYSQIQRLNQEVRRMKLEEDGSINEQKERLRAAQRQTLQFQCLMQIKMGEFIKKKIPLQLKIDQIKLNNQNANKDLQNGQDMLLYD